MTKMVVLPDNRKRKGRRKLDSGILSGKALETQLKREQALEMRLQGYTSFRQIGEALGVSGPRAFQLIQEEMESRLSPLVEQYRRIITERYEMLLAADFATALTGNDAAHSRVMGVLAALRRLHGVDAPLKMDSTVSGEVAVTAAIDHSHQHEITVRFVAPDGHLIDGEAVRSGKIPVDVVKPKA